MPKFLQAEVFTPSDLPDDDEFQVFYKIVEVVASKRMGPFVVNTPRLTGFVEDGWLIKDLDGEPYGVEDQKFSRMNGRWKDLVRMVEATRNRK